MRALRSLKPIAWSDYARVLLVAAGVPGWFAFIAWLEWSRAESVSKVIIVAITAGLVLAFGRGVWIYRPHFDLPCESDITDGPSWSSTYLDRTFWWVDVRTNTGISRVRLVQKRAQRSS